MSVLAIQGLHVRVAGNEILHGVDLEVASGEVHALMGPNGSGKSTLSHALMGRADYEVTDGSITIDGEELIGLPTWQRAQRGLFLAMQYPVEVPGVPLETLVAASIRARDLDSGGLHEAVLGEAAALGVRDELLARGVNDEFSGGEQKRAETVQLAVLATEVRHPRRDRLRPRRRLAPRRFPARRAHDPRDRISVCSRSRTTCVSSRSCAPTACT